MFGIQIMQMYPLIPLTQMQSSHKPGFDLVLFCICHAEMLQVINLILMSDKDNLS